MSIAGVVALGDFCTGGVDVLGGVCCFNVGSSRGVSTTTGDWLSEGTPLTTRTSSTLESSLSGDSSPSLTGIPPVLRSGHHTVADVPSKGSELLSEDDLLTEPWFFGVDVLLLGLIPGVECVFLRGGGSPS